MCVQLAFSLFSVLCNHSSIGLSFEDFPEATSIAGNPRTEAVQTLEAMGEKSIVIDQQSLQLTAGTYGYIFELLFKPAYRENASDNLTRVL